MGFWQLLLRADRDRVAKYDALIELAEDVDERSQKEKMRYIAQRWPGALREAELVAPERVLARRALCAQVPVGQERGSWRAGVGCLLACELNAFLVDYLQMRKSSRIRASSWDLGSALDSLSLPRRELWPPSSVPGLASHPPGTRLAYLGLAWTSGLSLPLLNRLIFEREWHWDRREDDPGWAHQSGPMERRFEDVR